MSLPHILLGLLREPASGYDLKTRFEESARHFWSAELSQIYPTLKRMERKGWLTSDTEPSDRGPDRRVYDVTAVGRAELVRWLESGPRMGTERFAYLGQISFMDELGDLAATREFMVALRARLASWLAELRAIEAEMARQCPGFPDGLSASDFHGHVALRMGLHSIAAKLEWCDETIGRIDRRTGRTDSAAPAGEHAAEAHSPEEGR